MAEGDLSLGTLNKMVAGDEVSYGVEVVGTQMLQLVSESLSDQPALVRSNVLDGRPQTRYADQGNITIGGDISTRMRYQPGNKLLANWFGSYAGGKYVALGTTEDKSLTVALDKRTSVWTYKGVKVNKIVIAGTPESVMLTASVFATALIKTSSLNTRAVLAAILDATRNIMYHHVKIRLGEQYEALSSANEIKVSTFTLTLDRPMDQIFTNDSQGIDQPMENNFRNLTGAFTVPRFRSEKYQNWKNAATPLQMDVIITDPVSGAIRRLLFPNVQLDAVGSPTAGPASLPINVTTQMSEAEGVLTSTNVAAASADNSLNIAGLVAATGTLTMSGVGSDGQTITVGADVYELDTEPIARYTAGRIRLNLSGGATRQAKGTLTLPTQVTDGDTMTIDSKVYTFETTLTNVDGNIKIGATLAETKRNIVNAINLTGNQGTEYAYLMTKHPSVSAAEFNGDNCVLTALAGGVPGDSIATTETFTAAGNVFDATTLGAVQAGVSPTAQEVCDAFMAAVNALGTEKVTATDGAGTTVVLTADDAGTTGNSIATTETLANGAFGAATLTGGAGNSTDQFPFCVPGSDAYVSGFLTALTNNNTAKVLSRTDTKLILANAAQGGFNLTTEAAGAQITVAVRTFDVQMYEY